MSTDFEIGVETVFGLPPDRIAANWAALAPERKVLWVRELPVGLVRQIGLSGLEVERLIVPGSTIVTGVTNWSECEWFMERGIRRFRLEVGWQTSAESTALAHRLRAEGCIWEVRLPFGEAAVDGALKVWGPLLTEHGSRCVVAFGELAIGLQEEDHAWRLDRIMAMFANVPRARLILEHVEDVTGNGLPKFAQVKPAPEGVSLRSVEWHAIIRRIVRRDPPFVRRMIAVARDRFEWEATVECQTTTLETVRWLPEVPDERLEETFLDHPNGAQLLAATRGALLAHQEAGCPLFLERLVADTEHWDDVAPLGRKSHASNVASLIGNTCNGLQQAAFP